LSSLKETLDPAETVTVSLAARGPAPQVIAPELTASTGLLLTGCRIAAVDVVPPATRVVQISERKVIILRLHGERVKMRTVSGNSLRCGSDDS
jgi:hypothetical protein